MRASGTRRRPVSVQQRNWVASIRLHKPAGSPSCDSRETPAHVGAAAHFRLLRNQEPKKGTPHVSKSNDGKIVERNIGPLCSAYWQKIQPSAASSFCATERMC